MARNQGLNRLTSGVKKCLNKAEIKRGFIFITKDQAVRGVLKEEFDVYVNGSKLLSNVCLDSYGRITGATSVTVALNESLFTISIRDADISITCPDLG